MATPSYHPVFELQELVELAGARLAAADRSDDAALVDSYLAVASMCQVVSDYLHRDAGDLRRIRKYASRLRKPAGGAAGLVLRATEATSRLLRVRREQNLVRHLESLEAFAGRLADALWGAAATDVSELRREWRGLSGAEGLPLRQIAIPPRCFFTFDQRPEDCIALAERFACVRPDRQRPVLVIGVRTSGCFMAPIVATALRKAGFTHVEWTSRRPGQPELPRDRRLLRQAAAAAAEVVIVDDPPTSGGSVARTADELVAHGIDAERVTLLLQLFPGAAGWSERLKPWRQVRLEWQEWHVHSLLDEGAVADTLSELLETRVARAVRKEWSHMDRRTHVRARFDVQILGADGAYETGGVLVTGVGLGLFADAAAAIGARLGGLVPDIHGTKDGLMYREWIPASASIDESDPIQRAALARHLARYAMQRASLLPVHDDLSARLAGHDAVWEQAARWLAVGFGRLALPLRPVLHSAAKRLLHAARPSLIDSDMGPGQWFQVNGTVLKRDFAEAPFVYQVPLSYDAAYDVAAAAAQRLPDEDFGACAREEFDAATGVEIDDARWFLYQVVSQADRRDTILRKETANGDSHAALVELLTDGERRAASLHRKFMAHRYLHDAIASVKGELCAIDIDGVLESGPWWYSSPSGHALLALRALTRHGFRPVIATGRSLTDVVQRCRDYRLAGGVAEYGSVMHDAVSGMSQTLISRDELEDLAALRRALLEVEGVELDPAFQFSIRGFTIRRGRRCAIDLEVAERVVAAAGLSHRIRIEQGWAQTDFVAVEVDKRTGLQALARHLGVEYQPPLALAVGDSVPDLSMFRLARLAAVPANAEPGLEAGTGAVRCRGSYGEGLAQAAGLMIGHNPGRCPECAAPAAGDSNIELVLALLEVGGASGLRKLPSIARVRTLLQRG
ncbi:MAG: hypothetical protein E6J20_04440 [Chloroflexi bacterium]|nr:MAG: hypothetical protein E6J20_04440 [Chloroflexota bacterium]